jgi:hypothetical protein
MHALVRIFLISIIVFIATVLRANENNTDSLRANTDFLNIDQAIAVLKTPGAALPLANYPDTSPALPKPYLLN